MDCFAGQPHIGSVSDRSRARDEERQSTACSAIEECRVQER